MSELFDVFGFCEECLMLLVRNKAECVAECAEAEIGVVLSEE